MFYKGRTTDIFLQEKGTDLLMLIDEPSISGGHSVIDKQGTKQRLLIVQHACKIGIVVERVILFGDVDRRAGRSPEEQFGPFVVCFFGRLLQSLGDVFRSRHPARFGLQLVQKQHQFDSFPVVDTERFG